jgi:hypothetical protein
MSGRAKRKAGHRRSCSTPALTNRRIGHPPHLCVLFRQIYGQRLTSHRWRAAISDGSLLVSGLGSGRSYCLRQGQLRTTEGLRISSSLLSHSLSRSVGKGAEAGSTGATAM